MVSELNLYKLCLYAHISYINTSTICYDIVCLLLIHTFINSFNRKYFEQYHKQYYTNRMGSKRDLKLCLCSVRLVCQEMRCMCIQFNMKL